MFSVDDRPTAIVDATAEIVNGELIVFEPATGTTHHLNMSAGSVWLVCDGESTVSEIAGELGGMLSRSPDELLPSVTDALSQLADAGLLEGFDAVTYRRPLTMTLPDGQRTLVRPPEP